jgi:hypothetical protein
MLALTYTNPELSIISMPLNNNLVSVYYFDTIDVVVRYVTHLSTADVPNVSSDSLQTVSLLLV